MLWVRQRCDRITIAVNLKRNPQCLACEVHKYSLKHVFSIAGRPGRSDLSCLNMDSEFWMLLTLYYVMAVLALFELPEIALGRVFIHPRPL